MPLTNSLPPLLLPHTPPLVPLCPPSFHSPPWVCIGARMLSTVARVGRKAGPAKLGPGKARETGMDSWMRALRLPGSVQGRWGDPLLLQVGGCSHLVTTWPAAELPPGGKAHHPRLQSGSHWGPAWARLRQRNRPPAEKTGSEIHLSSAATCTNCLWPTGLCAK